MEHVLHVVLLERLAAMGMLLYLDSKHTLSSTVLRVQWYEVAAKKGTEVYRSTVSIWLQCLK